MKPPLSIGYSGYEIQVYLEYDDDCQNEYYRAHVDQFPNMEEYADSITEVIDLMKDSIDMMIQMEVMI